jgi:hypothetical protein
MKVVKRQLKNRRARAAGLAALGMIVAALVFATATSRGNASENGLKLTVVATTKGPLTACQPSSDCSSAIAVPESVVGHFLYVENKRPLLHPPATSPARTGVRGAFVVSSVESRPFVDGVPQGLFTYSPPSNIVHSFDRRAAGLWPSTVTCPPAPEGSTDPCNDVKPPAILPGERTVAFFIGWAHLAGEPNGTLVIRFTIHGTLDGAPVELTADSPSIVMTN